MKVERMPVRTIRKLLVSIVLPAALAACGNDDNRRSHDGCDENAAAWTVWVTNQAEGFDVVQIFDGVTYEPIATVPVGRAPHNIDFSPDGRFAFVANLGTPPDPGSISVIDTSDLDVVATIPAGVKAHGVTVSPDGREVWVANVSSNDITVIDTGTDLRSVKLPRRHSSGTDVPQFSVSGTIPVGKGPALVAFTPDGKKAYVSNGKDGTASVIDVASHSVIKTILTGTDAMGLIVTPDGTRVFETEGGDNQVSVIDTAIDEVIKVLREDMIEAHGIALAGHEILITNRKADNLAIIDVDSYAKLGSVAVAGRPDIIGVSPDCRQAYLTNRDTKSFQAVDIPGRNVLATVDLGGGDPHGIAVLHKE